LTVEKSILSLAEELKQVLKSNKNSEWKSKKIQDLKARWNGSITIALLRLLEEDWWIRKEAERFIVWFTDHRTDLFLDALNHKNRYVRMNAAVVLGLLGGEETVTCLIRALNDDAWEVRAASARALGMLKAPEAVEPLARALNDECWVVRYAAAWSLGMFRLPKLLHVFVEHLEKESEETVRWELTASIGKLKSCAVKQLVRLLWDRDWQVRERAAFSLERFVTNKPLRLSQRLRKRSPAILCNPV